MCQMARHVCIRRSKDDVVEVSQAASKYRVPGMSFEECLEKIDLTAEVS